MTARLSGVRARASAASPIARAPTKTKSVIRRPTPDTLVEQDVVSDDDPATRTPLRLASAAFRFNYRVNNLDGSMTPRQRSLPWSTLFSAPLKVVADTKRATGPLHWIRRKVDSAARFGTSPSFRQDVSSRLRANA